MKRTFILSLAVVFLCGCVSTRYVPVETVKTEYKTNTVHDSIYIESERHDSVYVTQAGDTVYVTRWHTEYRDRWRDRIMTDTVIKTDSVQVPYPVERQLNKWEKFCLDYGKVTAGGTVVCIIILLCWLAKIVRYKGI